MDQNENFSYLRFTEIKFLSRKFRKFNMPGSTKSSHNDLDKYQVLFQEQVDGPAGVSIFSKDQRKIVNAKDFSTLFFSPKCFKNYANN